MVKQETKLVTVGDIGAKYLSALIIKKYCESRLDEETKRRISTSYEVTDIGIFDKSHIFDNSGYVVTLFPHGFREYIKKFCIQDMRIKYPTRDIQKSLEILWTVYRKESCELLHAFLESAGQLETPKELGCTLIELDQIAEEVSRNLKKY